MADWPMVRADSKAKNGMFRANGYVSMPCGKKLGDSFIDRDKDRAQATAVNLVTMQGARHLQKCKKPACVKVYKES